jgi:RHS repeat-associated protein
VIQERNASNVPMVSYTRGKDLSGSLEGAGGIGGLLARSAGHSGGNWTEHVFYHADGNGNITYLVSSTRTLAASYRYDPFGNLISKSGTLADANLYRFSSKELHLSSGLYYYLYRFYSPNLQRWISRDPIEEEGFEILHTWHSEASPGAPNLYGFVNNNPANEIDSEGLLCVELYACCVGLPIGTINCVLLFQVQLPGTPCAPKGPLTLNMPTLVWCVWLLTGGCHPLPVVY